MKKIIYGFCLVLLASCELGDFGENLQVNPNLLTPDQADPNFILNNIQKETADLLQDLNRTTDEVMRYTVLNETYGDVASDNSLNGEYTNYYAFLQDATIIENLAANDDDLLFHRGMYNILASYATVTMVDYLGDIPFSEAIRSSELIFNPATDDDEIIYNAVLERLDDAIIDIQNATILPLDDLYYGKISGIEDRKRAWIRVAKSLQLKMLVNIGDTNKINVLLAENDFISPTEDFEFQYGTNQADPNSRHPDFNAGYTPGGFGQFLGNSFLNLLLNDKTITDPRTRYYVYRQNGVDPSDTLIRCVGEPNFNFCFLGNAYYGRDHGDTRSRGADAIFRVTYGLYPVGGAFDEDNPSAPNFAIDTENQSGAGILPILLSSFVDFLRAEAAISLGTNDDAAALLESGIRKSMNKVLNFAGGVATSSSFAANQSDIDAYVTEVMTNFIAADDNGKLDIILTEYYLASYGNSTESYNGYRRTGFPSVFSAPIFDSNSPFPRSFSYPSDAVINNTQIDQRPITTQVFWDTNPAGFIN
ncbi:SusD/RagB family nutrient-binding outer membrane lipoprotein [Aquimarina sp. 2201CG14-23]|uniref:SusD/RagB family nutrient-binding outer membrane lipoprotein n=1 Tax=Aquimarina mycalae TaxID=3040073 RepID=UPI002478176D|nr:SusD/RagB family nutrient-binding outer membrane lipoprotein [Aquimarina sp. 2201CG14-23]MDH7445619.1 SusD/RagB family nutrient-binding outer membrane lipoprotein [Aquimarina sp. 2201CG14-23]